MTEYNNSYIYYYFINYTDLFYYDDDNAYQEFIVNIHRYSAVLGIILSVWTLILNSFVIVLCMHEPKTKSDIFYLQIVNFSTFNILIGGFVIPLTVYSILLPWDLGDLLCKTWIICDVLLPYASMLALVILNVDRLMLLTCAKSYVCVFQECLKPLILMAPWIISFVIIVPLWTHGSLPYEPQPLECIMMLPKSVAFAGTVITYIIPCLLLIFTALVIFAVRLQRHGRRSVNINDNRSLVGSADSVIVESKPTEMKTIQPAPPDSVRALFISDFLICFMWFPYHCMSLLIAFCSAHICMPSPILSQIVTWAATASASVVPVAWFVDKNIRQSCKNLICGKSRHNIEKQEEIV